MQHRLEHHYRRTVGRFTLLFLAFLTLPTIVGGLTVAVRLRGEGPLASASAHGVASPAPRPPTSHLALAVVVVGNYGTEITDSLPVLELLAASGEFEVRVVAPERRLSPFRAGVAGGAGLDFFPDLGFAEYDAFVRRAPELLVVPYAVRWQAEDASTIAWLRAHAGSETTVLSICRGAEMAAAAGLFDGHAATANENSLDVLVERHPAVHWKRSVRWVSDGRRISSALLASGMDATLAAIETLAGRPAAEHAVMVTGYKNMRALGDRSQEAARIPVGTVLEGAFRWERLRVGLFIEDGVSESAVAGSMDLYAHTFTTDTVVLADERRIVRSQYGVSLVPRGAIASSSSFDRVVVAGAGHPGAYGYDLAIEQVARTHGGSAARTAAELVNYSPSRVAVEKGMPLGLAVAARPAVLGFVGVAAMVSLLRRLRRRTVHEKSL